MTGDVDFARVGRKIARTQSALTGAELRRIMIRVVGRSNNPGDDAKGDIREAVRDDFGADLAMSNWRRNRPVQLKASDRFLSSHEVAVTPSPKGGPWQVAEDGRRGGTSVPRRRRRVTLATPWGPRTFTRENPMTLGPSRPKRTWSKAARKIEARTPPRVEDEMRQILVDIWRKG